MRNVTIIIPVFNEALHIVNNLNNIMTHLKAINEVDTNILIVDDGSTDGLFDLLQASFQFNTELNYLKLNRNCGKEAAISAGLYYSKASSAAIVMDSDLQHPPTLIKQMILLWNEGFEVVEACKASRGSEAILNKVLANAFYSMFDRLSGLDLRNQSDFKLIDRKVIDCYNRLPEKDRFFRGLINWMHFKTTQISFEVPATVDRESKWSRWRLFKYALSSISSFTALPLQIVTIFGGVTFLISLAISIKVIADKLSGQAGDGISTVILLILIVGSVLMFSLGMIGLYIAKIYEEVKRRPTYLIDESTSIINDL